MLDLSGQTFHWCGGIENTFIPQTQKGFRALEEYELTQHYTRWQTDLDLAASLGISHLRWGIPWYRVNPSPHHFDWHWVDEVLEYMIHQKGIHPILDLMHYGTPLWMEHSFVDSDYPNYVEEYAHRVAERYQGLITCYTPFNEPSICAEFCGKKGVWPPYLKGDQGYVQVLLQIIRGMVLTTQAIRQISPDHQIVQVEASTWTWTSETSLQKLVDRDCHHRYLPFDLFSGCVDLEHPLWPYLQQYGVQENDLQWFHEHAETVDVLGLNLYPWTGGEWKYDSTGQPKKTGELMGDHLYQVFHEAWSRYQIPLMVTETSARRDVIGRRQWMDSTVSAVKKALTEGLSIVGYTWFPLFTMIDWDYRIGQKSLEAYLLHLGLWDFHFDESGHFQPSYTSLVEYYRQIIQEGLSN